MKANELRIGNWVFDSELKECRVANLYYWYNNGDFYYGNNAPDDFDYDRTDIVDLDKISPIPLTEEWLLKFKIKAHNLENGLYDGTCVGYWPKSDCGYYFVVDANHDGYGGFNYTTTEISFVHELQNLYFAWHKEELTIE